MAAEAQNRGRTQGRRRADDAGDTGDASEAGNAGRQARQGGWPDKQGNQNQKKYSSMALTEQCLCYAEWVGMGWHILHTPKRPESTHGANTHAHVHAHACVHMVS